MNCLKKSFIVIATLLISSTAAVAQEGTKQPRKRHFSPEEFQAKQRAYITEKAALTQEEADAFFPLFFELNKKKFELERSVRKKTDARNCDKMTEEQCLEFVNNMSELKIRIAELEKEYTGKYLQAINACKLLKIRHAEMSFQRYLMQKMMPKHKERKKVPHNK